MPGKGIKGTKKQSSKGPKGGKDKKPTDMKGGGARGKARKKRGY